MVVRASLRLNFQLILVRASLTIAFQLRASVVRHVRLGNLRVPRHWREKRLISISAWFSQLPCLGV